MAGEAVEGAAAETELSTVLATGGLITLDLGLFVFDAYEGYKLYQNFKLTDNSSGLEPTPTTNPGIFEPVKGTPGKRDKITGEIWEKDKLHKNHFEVYKNLKDYQKGKRDRSVWEDGRPKGNL